MSNIYLDKEDVIAIAQQRPFKVQTKTKRQRWFEKSTYYGAFVLAIFAVSIAMLRDGGGDKIPNTSWVLFALALVIGITYAVGKYLNDEPLRTARREFITQWEKTGEIKPRWPIKAENTDTKRETPPESVQ